MEKKPTIGIDFGTTRCSVAVLKEAGHVEIIKNEHGHRTTPSIVAFAGSEVLVGETAKMQGPRNHRNTVFHTKRLIGRRFSDPVVQADIKLWPFQVVAGPADKPLVEVMFKGKLTKLHPEEISAIILMKLKALAEAELKVRVDEAVLTVPAKFSSWQRHALRIAAQIAGFSVVHLIVEPTAAALAYSLQSDMAVTQHAIVLDIGGGTFDVTLIEIRDYNISVKAVVGNTHLGCEDFDNRVLEHCIADFARRGRGKDLRGDAQALQRLRTQCERAKCRLSFHLDADIKVDSLLDGIDYSHSLSRSKFEELTSEYFEEMLAALRQCVAKAGLKPSMVERAFLCGGPSCTPRLRRMVEECLDLKVPAGASIGPDPNEAMVWGTAIFAANRSRGSIPRDELPRHVRRRSGSDFGVRLWDIVPCSLGIETEGGGVAVLVKRDATMPSKHSGTFLHRHGFGGPASGSAPRLGARTDWDHPGGVVIDVLEGESATAEDNRVIGRLRIASPKPTPVEITVEMGFGSEFSVVAVDGRTGAQLANIECQMGRDLPEAESLEMNVDDLRKQWRVVMENPKKLRTSSRKSLERAVEDPTLWGLSVHQLCDFYEDIRDELNDYCRAHALDDNNYHVCVDGACAEITPGTAVMLHGLEDGDDASRNGANGICRERDAKSGKLLVQLNLTDKLHKGLALEVGFKNPPQWMEGRVQHVVEDKEVAVLVKSRDDPQRRILKKISLNSQRDRLRGVRRWCKPECVVSKEGCCPGTPSCGHGKAKFRARGQQEGELRAMKANMHVVVHAFIRAMTEERIGYALGINKAQPLEATHFISHCWNEPFAQFVATLRGALPSQAVIWVCSLAIPQNAPIGGILSTSLEDTPFAKALRNSKQMLLAVYGLEENNTIETLTRAWCVYEGHLAVKYRTPLEVAGPDRSLRFYEKVLAMAKRLDLATCGASDHGDLERIRGAVRFSRDDFDAVNQNVRNAISWKVHDILRIITDNQQPQQHPRSQGPRNRGKATRTAVKGRKAPLKVHRATAQRAASRRVKAGG